MPLPMHMLTTPLRAPRRRISCISVATHLAPVAPNGCPSAMAPPLTFTFSTSSPSFSAQYVACDANASLSSKRSTSSTDRKPAFSIAAGIATAGPMPITFGSTPTAAKDTNRPMIGKPLARAYERLARTTHPAPSDTCDAFPGVVLPPFLKTAGNLASVVVVVPSRIPSSLSTTILETSPVFGSLHCVRTGTICESKRPSRCAAAALACDRAARVSCCSRVMRQRSATFSEVTPIGMRHDCASEDDATRGFMPPSHFIGLDVIVSTPAAMPTS
mmetsp:Transcript_12586/g.50574  ORF Transcript_12586/g.50574 Transcript_12586/m.50574 type:complete len:273 (-) Transcript_12586:449-1267(-)